MLFFLFQCANGSTAMASLAPPRNIFATSFHTLQVRFYGETNCHRRTYNQGRICLSNFLVDHNSIRRLNVIRFYFDNFEMFIIFTISRPSLSLSTLFISYRPITTFFYILTPIFFVPEKYSNFSTAIASSFKTVQIRFRNETNYHRATDHQARILSSNFLIDHKIFQRLKVFHLYFGNFKTFIVSAISSQQSLLLQTSFLSRCSALAAETARGSPGLLSSREQ